MGREVPSTTSARWAAAVPRPQPLCASPWARDAALPPPWPFPRHHCGCTHGCTLSPPPTHPPTAWIWERGHHRRVPAVAPRSKGSPQSTAGPRASGWGTAGEFLLDDCASWPAVRWGPGQENRTGARSAAKPLAEPGCFPAAPAPRGRGPRGADYVAKGKAFPQCCKAHISQGCIAARPPPRLPRAVCLAAGSTFIS